MYVVSVETGLSERKRNRGRETRSMGRDIEREVEEMKRESVGERKRERESALD